MVVSNVVDIFGAGYHQVAHHEVVKDIFQFGLNFIEDNRVQINVLAGGDDEFILALRTRKLTFVVKVYRVDNFPKELTLLVLVVILVVKRANGPFEKYDGSRNSTDESVAD